MHKTMSFLAKTVGVSYVKFLRLLGGVTPFQRRVSKMNFYVF